ncbi:MAG: DUF2892 domain-containing protein [Elusimicrobia bacterium]|nr:DUF2892 domain-containing protein [Elusimicrobiota bacterium]
MAIRRVAPAELEAALRRGAPALDVRSSPEHHAERIEGATLSPPCALERRAAGLDRAAPVYVFCARGPRSERAARRLEASGFRDVRVLEGGLAAWVSAGLPTLRDASGWTLERQVRLVAGSLVVAGVGLGWVAHPAFLALSAFVGLGLVFSAVTNTCGMASVLMRMPWNNRAD